MPAYKIASFENTDLPLIRKVAATGKPMIISTGMASVAEIDEAVRDGARGRLPRPGAAEMHQHLSGDAGEQQHPARSRTCASLFGCEVGSVRSHHGHRRRGGRAWRSAPTVIEKHFTLRRADGGVDSTFSMEPPELAALVVETERAWQGLGGISYGPTQAEEKSLLFRRSLYVAEDMKVGDVFTAKNLRVVRPGEGLHPRHYDQLLGRRINRDAKRGTPISWDLL